MGNVGKCNLKWYWGRWLVKQVKCSCQYYGTTTVTPTGTTTTVTPQTYSIGDSFEYTLSVSITGVSSIVVRFTKATSSSLTGKTTWTTTSSNSADYLFTDSSRYPQLHLVDGYSDCSKLPTSGSYSSFQLKEYTSSCENPYQLYFTKSEVELYFTKFRNEI